MTIYPIKMLKDEAGTPFIPLVAPESVIDTHGDTLVDMLENKVNEPETEGTAGQVLTTDGEGGRVWTTVQGGGGGTSDYTALSNKPQINSTTLSGNKTSADLGIENIFRYSTMPTASSTLLGQVVQYIGATTANYQNGSLYECITSPNTADTYVWSKISDNGCIYTARSATSATLIVYTPGDTDSSWSNSSAIGAAIGYINKAKESGVTQLDITFYDYGDAYNTSCSFLTARFRINPQTNAEINTSTTNSILISYNAHGSYSTNYAVVMKCTSTLKVWYSSTTAKYFRMALNFNGVSNTSHAYLAKDNTEAYTPTNDYNPATKKYVDDSISGIIIPNATSTTVGGIKCRYDSVDGTLYITNDGTNP